MNCDLTLSAGHFDPHMITTQPYRQPAWEGRRAAHSEVASVPFTPQKPLLPLVAKTYGVIKERISHGVTGLPSGGPKVRVALRQDARTFGPRSHASRAFDSRALRHPLLTRGANCDGAQRKLRPCVLQARRKVANARKDSPVRVGSFRSACAACAANLLKALKFVSNAGMKCPSVGRPTVLCASLAAMGAAVTAR